MLAPPIARALRTGGVIPAHPLALNRRGAFDERHQRALTRYYLDAGAAGIAVGVHTTQFAIRKHGLLRAVLTAGSETVAAWAPDRPVIRIAGVTGPTRQALDEAALARDLGYDLGLLSLGGLDHLSEDRLLDHVRAVGGTLPVMGFYLQPAVGGRVLSYGFWRRMAALDAVVAIKVAPFDRYRTLDVVRAVVDAGRHRDIALYTGNDDNIVADLTTPFSLRAPSGRLVTVRFAGGLLGHWAVWTRRAVDLVDRCREAALAKAVPEGLAALGVASTDANAAIFDAANGFRGSIAGIQEVLRRQGLLASSRCLEPGEVLSAGQSALISRVCRDHPELSDDAFVARHLDRWLG